MLDTNTDLEKRLLEIFKQSESKEEASFTLTNKEIKRIVADIEYIMSFKNFVEESKGW